MSKVNLEEQDNGRQNRILLDCFRKVLDERLTKKQKFIVEFLQVNRPDNITRLAKFLSQELDCSESCVWNNLNALKRCGLVVNGENRPVRLSDVCIVVFRGDSNG
ncbi:MAG: hypothetical protein COY38_01220 [Candidatus Aenigmarchaeota archaeon CG_4_10_14_0_8_um_filter_37_24]|nr:HTH domain-containing protein [Candidatus Aenigmarchaeota archaeon]PIW40822.1 MAG: hypothetical protein COW21_05095 [Candidatus Aenigmarchaeota archaeon CG15_BIG_FIL_POST_REV_8_21_14_020_37_27]PIX50488.1 MAG: hypothetical protein COZ52_03780 [Candidatus Aenigmarchaeota archaeon CG_4_8_14_3_um_filter_37_24]PIY35604.1 MAG: hypothetical protein COZ04_02855 [Candidatus Aenigmarchaeota archaeon CG_4_10_14_3_um_filter_37_21]PIZ35982.1 MAG: hypothetical protein COY38_01220 [Candidatus Aenigmarchaeo